MEEERPLTKQERRQLAKEERKRERESFQSKSKFTKIAIWVLVVGVLVGGGWWLIRESTKPLPGLEVEDIGREHVTDISNIVYNSNPPTSGAHFPIWAKRGVYDRTISDGYMIHSLEHGYVILSYNCTERISNFQFQISNVYADDTNELHDKPVNSEDTKDSTGSAESNKPLTRMNIQIEGSMSWFTPESQPDVEVELPEEFNSENCKDLVSKLSKFADKWQRVIVVPRPNLDTRIALTAWGRIDKFDDYDENRIEAFIKAFHNRGPEKTVE